MEQQIETLKTIIISLTLILILIISCEILEDKNQKEYIQNLEEKVNILTIEYENFALEDSLKQQEGR